MMLRLLMFVLVAGISVRAQEQTNLFTSAAPEVEKALRERVTGFYQAFVDGKFRTAEQYVAEDTKDLFYNQEKTKIKGFEIIKIVWDDGFKKASVVTTLDTVIQMRGQNIPAKAPIATNWKMDEGKWCYFVDPELGKMTPIGRMKPGPGNGKGMNIEEMIKNPNIILNQVKVSKDKFLLHSWEKSADSVVVTNGMQGSITISFQTESIPGLTYKMEKTELGSGETAIVELVYDPKDTSAKPRLNASLKIEPFGRTLLIPVIFDIPEDVKKQLPKP